MILQEVVDQFEPEFWQWRLFSEVNNVHIKWAYGKPVQQTDI
jgi:hypothetical protein